MKKFFLKSNLLLLMFLCSISALGAVSNLTFTANCNGSGISDDGREWTITSDGKESQWDKNYGIHYGTNSGNNVTYLQLATNDGIDNVTQVVVTARDAQAKATITVTVGGTSFTCTGSDQATNDSEDYTFTGSGSGEVVVRIDRGSSMAKAIYVKSVVVTYTSAEPSIAFAETNATVFVGGDTYTQTATTENIGDAKVEYSSDNTSVATVDATTGEVTGVDKGIANITATVTVNQKQYTASYTVNVLKVEDGVFDFTMGYNYESGYAAGSVKVQEGTWTAGNVTMVTAGRNAWYNALDLRIYKSSGNDAAGSITFTTLTGGKISNIEFTGSNLNNMTTDDGTYSNGTWTGNATSVTFTATDATTIKTATVTYGDAPAVVAPVFSLEPGSYIGTQKVGLSCATADATIFYTTDGSEPTNGSTKYDGEISVAQTQTIKAIAELSGEYSEVAVAEYIIVSVTGSGTESDPYTVADANAIINAGFTPSAVCVQGIVSQVDSYNATYSSVTYWLSDDGTTTDQIEAYSGKAIGNSNFTGKEQVQVGDIVIVKGDLKKYNNINEFNLNNYLVSQLRPITVSDAGYRTYCSPNDLDFSSVEGLNAYVGTLSDNTITFTKADKIPAGNGMLLEGKAGTYTVPCVENSDIEIENDLVGVTTETVVSGNIYVLYNGESGIGFYKTASESFTVGANTAYLPATVVGTNAKVLRMAFADGVATGVEAVAAAEGESEVLYNVAGQQVGKDYKGIVIKNGKKYLNK